ncbi:phage terminase large subunit family protein [Undibacterium sp. Di26W]|uniref:phage terminase large subunit family protein n=1 Tax=Undibacterium sp. Di26W TaxID=3413035 RepID=UPI003BF16DC6
MPDIAIHDVTSGYSAFRPPKRVTVAEGAAKTLYIKQPGGYNGYWSPAETPYMIEPMNMMASRRHEAVSFIGPARTGKTVGLLDGFIAYAVTCDPGDTLIIQMTQEKAREFSKQRIDRALRHSPDLAALKSSRANDDNTHDKTFKNGMTLKIGWPTVSQVSSSDYRYVLLTDYDRVPDDIDGEGALFPLAKKRTTTFLSRGMTAVESSPGRPIEDPFWKPATSHEAPPVKGILGIYNTSDRRRWYWQCLDCYEHFEAKPGLDLFNLPPDDELLALVRTTDIDLLAREHDTVKCPHCGSIVNAKHKYELNRNGLWLPDGVYIDSDRVIQGTPMTSNIAGYWLGGVAAAYQSWTSLIVRYLQGLRSYAQSGDETALQATVNTDQGMPYTPRILIEAAKGTEDPSKRREKDLERFLVPEEARYLVASVDIQGGSGARFVVQVHAVGESMEQWLIDRYSIELSKRVGMGTDFAPVDPASYQEDWELLTEQVVMATYRLAGEEDREMRIKIVVVDTGGEHKKEKLGFSEKKVGVSEKAYQWYRSLRTRGLHGKVMLIKGASTPKAPLFRPTMVGAQIKGQEGDVPLYLLNTNTLKDQVQTSLKRTEYGPGYMHFPLWLGQWFFDELQAEVRNANGTWMKVKRRNEALDLSAYIRAGCMRLGADKIEWSNPPSWAAPLSQNTDVISAQLRRKLQEANASGIKTVRPPRRRSSGRSGYLS